LCTSTKFPWATGSGLTSKSSDETVYDVGSIVFGPHILLSSRKHFRKAGLSGLRASRAYCGLSGNDKARHGDIHCPNSRQAPSGPRLEGLASIVCTPFHKVYCWLDRKTLERTCQEDGVGSRDCEKTWGISFARVTTRWWADGRSTVGEISYMYQVPPLTHEACGRQW